MKVVIEKPPIYDEILASGMHPSDKTIYTYGDTIFNPGNAPLADHLLAHEETHAEQQGDAPYTWWSRYLDDQWFRIDQESEAYARQYDFICQKTKDRNQRVRVLMDLSRILSGPVYGNVITTSAAMNLIKGKTKTK